MTRQLQLPTIPAECCHIACHNSVAYVLLPGGTGHCEAHNPDAYRTMPAWAEAFAAGTARIVRRRV